MKNRENFEEAWSREQELREILQNPVEIPDNVEARIRGAYAAVREKCRETEAPAPKTSSGRKKRKLLPVFAAAGVLATATLGVLASGGYFARYTQQQGDQVSFTFDIDYTRNPVSVEVVPGYLPEGMLEQETHKYWSEDNWGHGISIIPLNTQAIDTLDISWDRVDEIEETTLCGMEANIIHYKERDKYKDSTQIYLFNPEDGYLIWVCGDYSIDPEEVKKVADHLQVTVSAADSLEYLSAEEKKASEAEKEAENQEWKDLISARNEKGITAEELSHPGETLANQNAEYTVRRAYVVDSIQEIPGYSTEGVYDMEELTPWLLEDGTLRPYLRQHYDLEDCLLGEEETAQKFLVVEASVTALQDTDEIPLDGYLRWMEKREDGSLTWKTDYYEPVPSEEYHLQRDNTCFYMDQPEHLEGALRLKQFFWRNLEEGEHIEYTMAFVVDADLVPEGDLSCVLLKFNGMGNNELDTRYYALN
ncbi:MAG: hypothetical protein SOZ59_05255 [Candidatus Limivivens sp.]|nr:hypothetical protein [Candidatus Limivivens sp.]